MNNEMNDEFIRVPNSAVVHWQALCLVHTHQNESWVPLASCWAYAAATPKGTTAVSVQLLQNTLSVSSQPLQVVEEFGIMCTCMKFNLRFFFHQFICNILNKNECLCIVKIVGSQKISWYIKLWKVVTTYCLCKDWYFLREQGYKNQATCLDTVWPKGIVSDYNNIFFWH